MNNVFALFMSVFAAVYFVTYLAVYQSELQSFINYAQLNLFVLFLSKFVNWILIV